MKVTRWPVDPLSFSKKNPSRAIRRSTYIQPPSLAKIRQRTSEEIGNKHTHKQTNAARIIVWLGNIPVERAKDAVCSLQWCGLNCSAWCRLLSYIIYIVSEKVTCWPIDPLTFSKKNPSRAIPRNIPRRDAMQQKVRFARIRLLDVVAAKQKAPAVWDWAWRRLLSYII